MKADESVIDFPKVELCPDIWEKVMSADGMHEIWQLKPEVEHKLIDIVKMTCEEAYISFDNTYSNITGSITSNCYTSNADIDLHIHLTSHIRETVEMTQNRFKDAFAKVKKRFDMEGLKGDESYYVAKHPIEVYYQPNEFQDMMSVGCYNLTTRKWIVGPEFKDQSYNPYSDLYKEIQAKSDHLAQQIRNMILSIYEIAVVFKKNYNTEFGPQIRPIFLSKLSEVQGMYDKIRNMRKAYSSPESAEQAMKYRQSRKWKVADASFKLFDKYGYTAIMKKFIEDYELIENSADVDFDIIEDVLSTVKNYINNADKLAEQEIESEAEESQEEVTEGIGKSLSLATIVGLMAIPNILPAASLEKNLAKVQMKGKTVNSPEVKKAIANATIGKQYNGMSTYNIVNAVARTIFAEAQGEGKKGQAAIASVIWNRAGGKAENLISVISKYKQFSCWNEYTGGWKDQSYTYSIPKSVLKSNNIRAIWNNCIQLAKELVDEDFTSTIGNRNSYMNKKTADKSNVDSWGDKLDMNIGKHNFGYLANNDGFKRKNVVSSTYYIVKRGDTLSKIAKDNNTTINELVKKNGLKNPNILSIGQKLII